jgi:hypothetical protein
MVSTKVYALIATMALTGCAHHNITPPVDVRLIPNDCSNQQMIVNYLIQQSRRPRQMFESEKEYELTRAEIRSRIWNVRYHCNPV